VEAIAYVLDILLTPIKFLAALFTNLAVAIHNFVEFLSHPFTPSDRDNWQYVPLFDKGGFTTSEGLAYVHKNEYIIPVAKANSLAMAGAGGGNMIFRLEVDRRVLGQVIAHNGRDGLTRTTGSSMGRAWK
ncbi:MAG: hypothetical protein WC657_05600, partial [Candidatus Paceibacterota bacterium]